jgi:universal stress protein A
MATIHTILHPTDFSARSDAAFRLACSLARDHHGHVVVLHVVPPPVAHGEIVARRQDDSFYEELHRSLNRMHAPDPETPVMSRLEEGDPAREILRVAEEVEADLIVMGTHGRTGLSRLLLGSAAEEVMRHATCPVLTVKSPAAHPVIECEAQTEEAVG